jgi:hypothetical protein
MSKSPPRGEVRAPAIVVLIVRLTATIGRLSPYRPLYEALNRRERSRLGNALLADRPRNGIHLLADDAIDVAAVYVVSTLTLLLAAFLAAPAWADASSLGRIVAASAVALATWRYVDIVAYHAGILLDPRQDLLRSPARSLVLLVFNVCELTLTCAIVLHVLGAEDGQGHAVDRVDAWLRAVDLIALLEPIKRATLPLVTAQVLTVAAGILLLVVGVGILLGLMTQEFRNHST